MVELYKKLFTCSLLDRRVIDVLFLFSPFPVNKLLLAGVSSDAL